VRKDNSGKLREMRLDPGQRKERRERFFSVKAFFSVKRISNRLLFGRTMS
jgi:hypothetical protein